MPYLVYLIPAGIVLIIAVILGRTAAFRSRRYAVEPQRSLNIDVDRAAERLSRAVQLPTITVSDPEKGDWGPFEKFIRYLEQAYPSAHGVLEREIVNGYSLLYRWKGRDESLKPVLFLAHIDVVPVEEGTEQDWHYPPFSGALAEGFVWGRGTMDVKNQLISVLEAVEYLAAEGFTPARDFYFAFGHDEETRGEEGAVKLSELLQSRGLSFEYILDEGGAVTLGAMPGVKRPIALVGIAEKGYADIRITAQGEAGHSSMPPRHTAAGLIGRAVAALEKRQRPARISPYLKETLAYVGPEMGFGLRLILANLWLFGPLFKMVFKSSRAGNALLRTTTAVTVLEGGSKPNVLPQKASAVINYRIAPGESVQELLDHVREVVGDKIKVEPIQATEPSKISPVDGSGFQAIEQAVYAVFPEAATVPYIVMGGTDAIRYEPVCDQIYRFTPMLISKEDLDRLHGTNERLSLENIERGIRFYIELFKR
ncbi:MAG TPA: M20 family peptidase [Bacillota bacterium]|jgi:carboxypeptidase PM20D1|nr:M20/M25/M40 family metallo-hydrolase [Bacillota bacterium]HOA35434.1 M20 family peptidase [Bacillota bacterium]HPZ11773.1 M20 family peptidase [Bacillota bacterium]HQE10002.1 M20 family peptidase [Bacillota bacterium]